MRRILMAPAAALLAVVLFAAPALACGGLIGPNGAVNLLRTTTLAGYHAGIEHYVTAFEFAGGGGRFGSIIPLPGVPSKVERGGDWTLQRLVRETASERDFAAVPAASETAAASAEVILQVRIDALDITVLKGGGASVGTWATQHGFRLPPDAPAVLDFYANRSPIFLAASFDADAAAARGQQIGDGTPVHITIPTANPWVPLRILGLGKQTEERILADVYLLTDDRPALLPGPSADGFQITYDQAASGELLRDLRTDKGGDWVPAAAWLTKLSIDASPDVLQYDLAVDASGLGAPSRAAAGLPPLSDPPVPNAFLILAALLASISAGILLPWWRRAMTPN